MRHEEFYTFPAVRGIQGAREYYVTMCSLRVLPRLFDNDVSSSERAQRRLNKTRIPVIKDYILNNIRNYVLPPIIASIDGPSRFVPLGDEPDLYKVGTLEVGHPCRFFVNDGQHRLEAIKSVMEQAPDLAFESIVCVFYVDTGLPRRQQLFSDLNRYSIRSTRSLAIFYDRRDPKAEVARQTARQVRLFNGKIDVERDSLPRRSPHLFTLNALYNATSRLLAGHASEPIATQVALAVEYWNGVCASVDEWMAVLRGELSPIELRAQFVHGHAVTLMALGYVGRTLMEVFPRDWVEWLSRLRNIDWRRDAAPWVGRTIVDGRIIMSDQGVLLTARELARALGVPLSTI